jgi:hypothetical protein
LAKALVDFVNLGADVDLAPAVDTIQGYVSDRVIKNISDNIDNMVKIDAIMTEGKATRKQIAIDRLRGAIPVRAMEKGLDVSDTLADLEESIGMNVRRDKSLPTGQYRHTLISTRFSMLAISDALNKDIKSIVPKQSSVLLRVSRKSTSIRNDEQGRQTTVNIDPSMSNDEDVGSATAIAISSTFGGAFIHEFGHLVAETNSFTAEETKNLLENSGVRGRVFRAVKAGIDLGLIDEKAATYLRSDEEIFARSFEAVFVNRAIDAGDFSLKTLGGFSAAYPGDPFSPFGDSQLTERFLTNLNTLLDTKQALSFEAKSVTNSTIEP